MTTFEYTRMGRWMRSERNGWTGPDVAARFEAGTRGEHYLEFLQFDRTIGEQPAARELLDVLARTGLDQAVVLDFGCANGVFKELFDAVQLTPRWTYVGADVNRMNIESCRRRYPNSRFDVVTEGRPLPFADESVDLVIASGVLECVERPAELLAEFRRVTRAWITLCRIGVRPEGPPAIYWQSVRHSWGLEEHSFHVFVRREFEEMIARTGLEIAWQGVSVASGEWIAPDNPEPLQHFSFLLRKT